MSSACDGWQPIEAERRLTRSCCDLLLKRGFRLNVLTKSELVVRDLDLFAGRAVRVSVTITALDERLRRVWEPGAPSVEARFRVIEAARRAGLDAGIMFAPLLPFLSDARESLDVLFERAADLGIGALWVDALNARPKVWPSVAELLRKRFPDLRERYRRILFDPAAREAYLCGLRNRVTASAGRFSLQGRLALCF